MSEGARPSSDSFKHRLHSGDVLLGGEIATALSWVPVAFARCGLDFAWIDMEHSLLDLETVGNHIRVSSVAGLAPLVRVPGSDTALIKRLLDNGAAGIILPFVETPEAASELVRASRFHPRGSRGAADPRPAHGFLDLSLAEHIAAEEATIRCVQIESRAGVDAVDAIVAVEGLDLVVVGLGDLSVALERPGDVTHPEIVAAATAVLDAARRAGVACGVAGGYGSGPTVGDAVRVWRDHGATFFHFMSDQGLLADALRESVGFVRAALY